MKILVIGRGRSGTKATAVALQKIGLDVLHERMGKNGSVHNGWAQNVNGRPPLDSFDYVWHVVREPKANIASNHTQAWTGNSSKMPLMQHYTNSIMPRCAIGYYEWNLECEKTLQEAAAMGKHTWRFRIEDDWLPIAMSILNIEGDAPELEKGINTRKSWLERKDGHSHPGELCWAEVLDGLTLPHRVRLLDITERYGYATPETEAEPDAEAVAEDEEAVSNLGCA